MCAACEKLGAAQLRTCVRATAWWAGVAGARLRSAAACRARGHGGGGWVQGAAGVWAMRVRGAHPYSGRASRGGGGLRPTLHPTASGRRAAQAASLVHIAIAWKLLAFWAML